jgi:GH18 family chitinase
MLLNRGRNSKVLVVKMAHLITKTYLEKELANRFKQAVGAYCVGGDGGFVTYDNPETVSAKAVFCKQKGLGVSLVSTTVIVVFRHW